MTTRPAIRLGKHLAEQLEALGMSAAALARKLRVPTNPHHAYPQRSANYYRRYGAAFGTLFRY